MAQIDLERKRSRGWWPWILGLLGIVVLVWVVAEMFDGAEEPVAVDRVDTVATSPTAVTVPPREYATFEEARVALPGTIREYRQACTQAGPAPQDMGMQHEFTVNCMRLMAASFDAAIQSDSVGQVAIGQRLDTFRANADRLEQSDPSAMTHADVVAETMRSAADMLSSLRDERFAEDQELEQIATRARNAADSMTTDRAMLEQQDSVEEFFQAMGEALESIASENVSRTP